MAAMQMRIITIHRLWHTSYLLSLNLHSLDGIMHRSGHLHPLHGPPSDTNALQLGPLEATDVVFVVPLVDGGEGSSDQFHTAAATGLSGSAGRPAGILGRYHGADHGIRESRGLNTHQSAATELGGENRRFLTTAVAVAVAIGIGTWFCAICHFVITFGLLGGGVVRGRAGSLYLRRTKEDMHRCIAVVLNVAGEEVALGGRAHGCLLVALICWFEFPRACRPILMTPI